MTDDDCKYTIEDESVDKNIDWSKINIEQGEGGICKRDCDNGYCGRKAVCLFLVIDLSGK